MILPSIRNLVEDHREKKRIVTKVNYESGRDRMEKQRMQKDIEDQGKVLNFQSHPTKRKKA